MGHYEKLANNLISSIEERAVDLQNLQGEINMGKIHDIDSAKDKLMKIILSLEEEANSIDGVINSMNSKIDNLRSEESNLYRDIKQTYPTLSDDLIKDEIHQYLTKEKV